MKVNDVIAKLIEKEIRGANVTQVKEYISSSTKVFIQTPEKAYMLIVSDIQEVKEAK